MILLQLVPGHAADAGGLEVGLLGLDAAQAAEVLVALLLPLGDQVGVGLAVLEAPVVQRLGDLVVVVQVPDVARPLVRDLEDGPLHLLPLLALVRRVHRVLHRVVVLEQRVLDVFIALRWRLLAAVALACADDGHGCLRLGSPAWQEEDEESRCRQ